MLQKWMAVDKNGASVCGAHDDASGSKQQQPFFLGTACHYNDLNIK